MGKYIIEMGDNIRKLWEELQSKTEKFLNDNKDKNFEKDIKIPDYVSFYKKIKKVIGYLENEQRPAGFSSRKGEILDELSKVYSKKVGKKVNVHHGYLENNTSGARRVFWAKRPNKSVLVIIGIDKHPSKTTEYSKVDLDDFPDEEKEDEDNNQLNISLEAKFKDVENLGNLFYVRGAINKDNSIFVCSNSDKTRLFVFLRIGENRFIFIKINEFEFKSLISNRISLEELLENSNEIYLLSGSILKTISLEDVIDYLPDKQNFYFYESLEFLYEILFSNRRNLK